MATIYTFLSHVLMAVLLIGCAVNGIVDFLEQRAFRKF